MANNLSGISYTSNFNNLDGLSVVDADTLIIDGVTIDPTNIVPYVGADKTVNLGAQNIQTSHAPVASADLVNLQALQDAVAYIDAGVAASFLNKVTTSNQTVAGNVQMNGGLTLTQNTVCNQLQLQSNDNTTMAWTTSVSNGTPNDLTFHAVQTSKDIVFRDTGYIEAEGVKVTGATALRAVVTDVNKNLATSATTATEIGYLSGVTSGIQTQINGLVPYTGATGILNMGSNLVRSTAVPIAGQDLCNKTYVDGRDATKVSIAGDTMTGTLNMGTNKVTTSYVPTANVDLTNKLYVDSAVASAGGQWTTSGSNIYSNNSGNVGIGVTNPVAKLSVYDWAHFGDATDSTKYGFVQITRPAAPGDNKFHISFIRSGARVSGIGYLNGSDTVGWVNNNDVSQVAYGMYLTNAGNVGIGTTTPSAKLQVYGTSYPNIKVGGPSSTIELVTNTVSPYNTVMRSTGGRLDFEVPANYPRLTIEPNNGYVGIGLTNPGALLQLINSTGSYTSVPTLAVSDGSSDNNGSYGMINLTRPANPGDNKSHIACIRAGNNIFSMGYFNNTNTFGFLHSSNMLNSNGMVIAQSGYVGIGTTTPISLVTGKAASYSQPLLILDAGMANWSGIGAGNVPRGIGQPLMRLGNTSYTNVAGDYYGIGLGYGPNATDYAASEIGWISTNQAGQEEGDLLFSTRSGTTNVAATERQRIKSTGAVGFNGAPVSRHYIQTNRTYTPEQALWTNNSHVCISYDSPQTNQSPSLFFHQYNTTTNPVNSISVIGSLAPSISWNTMYMMTGTTYWYYNGSQVAYLAGGGWVNTSDKREKQDIQPLNTQNSLRKVLESRPTHYERIYRDGDITIADDVKRKRYIGFLAQEQLNTNPYCVSEFEDDRLKTEEDDGKRFGVCYNDYIVHLVGAVQEQQKIIETLTQRSQIMEEHSRKVEEDLKTTTDAFTAYKELTDTRLNKLASLVSQLMKA